jgi:hypothetical protein
MPTKPYCFRTKNSPIASKNEIIPHINSHINKKKALTLSRKGLILAVVPTHLRLQKGYGGRSRNLIAIATNKKSVIALALTLTLYFWWCLPSFAPKKAAAAKAGIEPPKKEKEQVLPHSLSALTLF